MTDFFHRIFPVHPGEGPLLAVFAGMTFTLFFFLTIGHSAVDSLFMAHAGGAMIPYAWICLAALAIPLTLVFTRINATQPSQRTLASLLWVGTALIVSMRLLVGHIPASGHLVFYAVKELYVLFLLPFFWAYLASYLDTQQSKRIIPLLGAVWSFGDFAGGKLTGWLARWLGAQELFTVWAVGTLCLIPFLQSVERRFTRAAPAVATQLPSSFAFLSTLRQLGTNPLLLSLATLPATFLAIGIVLRFRYYEIFGQAFPQPEEGAAYLGNLRAWASAFKFAMAVAVLPRMIYWFGVRNVILLQPLASLIVLLTLAMWPGVPTAALGFFVAVGMGQAVFEPALNLAFNLLPLQERTRLGAFFSGITSPLGAISVSLLLLAIPPTMQAGAAPSLIGLVYAAAFIIAAWALRHHYFSAVLQGLQTTGRYEWNRTEQGPLAGKWIEELANRWEHASSDEKQVILTFVTDPALERPFVVEKALADPDPTIRALLFARAHSRWKLQPFEIAKGLQDPSPTVRLEAARYAGSSGFENCEALMPLLSDPNPGVRAEAAVSLWQIGDLSHVATAVQMIFYMLNGERDEVEPALRALGRLGDTKYMRSVLPFAQSSDLLVRKAAANAMRHLASPVGARWIPDLARWLEKARGQERRDLIAALVRIGGEEAARVLLDAADTQRGRFYSLRDALLELGRAAVGPALQALKNPERPYSVRMLALSTLNRMQKVDRSLALQLAEDSLLDAIAMYACAHRMFNYPQAGPQVLGLLFHERAQQASMFVIRCLFAWNRCHGVRWVEQGLRSMHRNVRANAGEALLNLTPTTLRSDIQKLLDPTTIQPADWDLCLARARQEGGLWAQAANESPVSAEASRAAPTMLHRLTSSLKMS